jgi:glucose/arabinose dehydrogenase
MACAHASVIRTLRTPSQMMRRWFLVTGRVRIIVLALPVALAACGVAGAARSGSSPHPDASAHEAAAQVRLVGVGSFNQPIGVTGAPGDPSRVFVVQRGGQVMLLLDGHVQARPFLDVSASLYSQGSDEQGLLGLAFAPNYASSGLFYVDYTVAGNDIEVVQYRRSAASANLANPASAHVVLTIDHHLYTNHNGGQLAFGPDGDLYVGVGDGGSEDDPDNNGQNTDTLLGKILRIDPSPAGGYTIPPTNPFVGQSGKRAEIWAYGLRNPWRFSFDRATGDLIVGDVGQNLQEEVDFAPAGTGAAANYGWSIWEGDRRNKSGNAPHTVFPVLIASHSSGYCAIIGGYVVRDRSLPRLYGHYLFGDYCRSQIESVVLDHGKATDLHATGLNVGSTTSFGEDASGHIYITSLNGPVYRIASR